jgi:hypothetical protein
MNITLKTGYEWCLEANMRILNISYWDTQWALYEESYYEEKIDLKEFYRRIELCKVKPNSMPRKTEMYLEYRMYGMCNYQLSNTIHGGIQFGHCCIEYQQMVSGSVYESTYNKWAKKDKTFIILNGGTTNDNKNNYGTLQKNRNLLKDNDILFSEFREPDLNNTLTAICFLVDERVWNKELYKDFIPETLPYSRKKNSEKALLELENRNLENYNNWVVKIGGPKNVFLREFLKDKKLL